MPAMAHGNQAGPCLTLNPNPSFIIIFIPGLPGLQSLASADLGAVQLGEVGPARDQVELGRVVEQLLDSLASAARQLGQAVRHALQQPLLVPIPVT